MGLGGFLFGKLGALIYVDNIKELARIIADRLLPKQVEVHIEFEKDGNKYKIDLKVKDQEELKEALQKTEEFLKQVE